MYNESSFPYKVYNIAALYIKEEIWNIFLYIYSRTSMAQTLMAHSPELARTIIMVHTGHFKHNPPWMAGTTLG